MYIHINVYIFIYIDVYVYIYMYILMDICIFIYICTCIWTSRAKYKWMRQMYIHSCIHIYTYIHWYVCRGQNDLFYFLRRSVLYIFEKIENIQKKIVGSSIAMENLYCSLMKDTLPRWHAFGMVNLSASPIFNIKCMCIHVCECICV